jgi:16S rRNA (uracil1498-N3)-methyltransferase
MRIPRIYLPSELKSGESTELSEYAFQHAIKVLRLKQDAVLILFDGNGHAYESRIETINKKNALVKIGNLIPQKNESNLTIHLGLGISKGERMDYAIQKAVELGVSAITPLFTEHCVVNLDDKRSQKRIEHWRGVIISACEQCGRNILPTLHDSKQLNSWTENINETCLILDPQANVSLKSFEPENNKVSLLIGPEGGLSANEISGLTQKINFHPVRFGPRILRTETAAVAAITALQLLWGDLLN